jgi:hypothetical protein
MLRRTFIPALVSLLALTGTLRAEDTVVSDGLTWTGTIVGLKEGRLALTLPAGDKLYDLSKVSKITIAGNQKFNDAEAVRTTDPKKSAALYKEAIRAFNEPEIKQLAQLRAVAPTDADGRYTEALAYFLEVYAAAPNPAVWALHPTHIPAGGSSMLKEAVQKIADTLKNFKSDEAKANLKNLQLDLLTRAGDTEAAQRLAREIATGVVDEPKTQAKPAAAVDPAAQMTAVLAEIDAAIRNKNYDGALKQIDAQLATASGENAVQLFILKARVYEDQGQLDLATATLLRVSAHYPSSPTAPAALLQAATLQKRANHPQEAKTLLDEVVTQYPDSREAVVAKNQ